MRKKWQVVCLVSFVLVLRASAVSAQSIGSAGNFGALGATTVTNAGASIVTGDLGVSPGTAITGFLPSPANTIVGPGTVTPGPGLVSGTIHADDMVAAQAHADAVVGNAGLIAMTCPAANNLSGQVLGTGAAILPPGVYCFNSSAQLTGTLTLIGTGPWVFQIASTLITAVGSAVVVASPTANCGSNVFWQVGSSATIDAGTQFVGNILATASITLVAGANVSGSAIALAGAVTMDTNHLSACTTGVPPPITKCDADDDKDHHDKDHDRDHDKDKDKDHKDNDKDHKDGDKDHKDSDNGKKKY